jgi:hypothetical protein
MRNNMMKAKWKKKTAAAELNKLVHEKKVEKENNSSRAK